MEVRRCEYCSKQLDENKRSNAKFCDRNCKSNNRKMKTYWLKKKEQGIQEDLKKIENYKKLIEIIKREE